MRSLSLWEDACKSEDLLIEENKGLALTKAWEHDKYDVILLPIIQERRTLGA